MGEPCSTSPTSGIQAFRKAYKLWMKAQAKLIKFNRIKMWLVTQHDFKVAILNDRKQSVLRVLGHRTHKVDLSK